MPEDISLLPKEVEQRKEQEARGRLLRKGALLFLAVAFFFGVGAFVYSLALGSQLSSLEQSVASEESKARSLAEVELSARDLENRMGALKTVLGDKIYFSGLLTTLANAVPADVSVTELTAPSEETVSISGGSRSYGSLANFLLTLKEDGSFEAIELKSVSLDPQTGEAHFDLNLTIAEGALRL